ncbi:MAG: DUF1700 domain-containing protein [Bacilli bacterium]|nr:DUF1700 domain-containing protein [Bacilli bacterium]
MSKKDFLNKLAKKLSVLDDSERQDILTEYTDTINEKVKQGQTEEEAVKDFGNIDDLVKEILKAYKINPDFDEKDELQEEGILKQSASVIADFSLKLANRFKNANNNINLSFIIEIVIRIFVVLILLLILSGVVTMFGDIGSSVINNMIDPFGAIINVFWKMFLVVLFIALTILLIIAMFKRYFGPIDDNEVIMEPVKKSNNNGSKVVSKNKVRVSQPVRNNGNTLGDVCLLIVKIFVIMWVIIPLMFLDCFTIFGLVATIIYLIKGLHLIGLVLILLGASGLTTYIIVLLFSLLFGKGKVNIIAPIASVVLMIIGTVMFISMIFNIEYYDESPVSINEEVETKKFNTTEEVLIHYAGYYNYDEDIQRVSDNTMKDGEFTLEVTYNKDYFSLNIDEDNDYIMQECDDEYDDEYDEYEYELHRNCVQKKYNRLVIYNSTREDDFNDFKKVYNLVIDNLKENRWYNYNKMYSGKLKITANENTQKMINFE